MKKREYRKGKRVHWEDWVIGEVYFLEGGSSPFYLVSAPPTAPWNTRDERNFIANYLSGVKNCSGTKTYLCKAELIEGENKMPKLYEIKTGEEPKYGHKLAKNSSGQWVMEVKGTGEILAVSESNVEEVLPFTIAISFDHLGKTYHCTSEKDKHEVGDLHVIDAPSGRCIVRVEEVDTKSTQATKEFKSLGKLMLDK